VYIGEYYFDIPKSIPQLDVTSIWFVVFILIVFALARPFKSKLRPFLLLIANAFFLYTFSVYHLIAVGILALVSYGFSFIVKGSKRNLIISIVPFVLVLIYFKYAGLLIGTNPIMPLGLSFYTFKILSYLIDVYRGTVEQEKNILYYLDYVMFFPTITAGPINRSKEFLDELRNPESFDYIDAKQGGFQLVCGIFEKIVFCDFVGSVVNRTLDNPEITGSAVILGIVCYSIQIYLDFDAASNIAIGGARLLGFHIPKNFNSPYLASNLKDFWRRWHISLSTWFRDYLYIPLGGNQKGTLRKYINIIIVFIVSGLWHGSTFNFLLWGLLHGLIQVVEDIILKSFKDKKLKQPFGFIIKLLGIVINFTIVTFLWLIFRYQTIAEVTNVLNRIAISTSFNLETVGVTLNEWIWLITISVFMLVLDIFKTSNISFKFLNRWCFFPIRWIVYILMIVVFLIFGMYGGSFEASDFIYKFF